MRPANDDRIIVEYVRVHRIIEPDLFSELIEPFGVDLLGQLTTGVEMFGRWWQRDWRLGNVEPRKDANDDIVGIGFQFGWYGEADSSDAPPPYNEAEHAWSTEPARVREGALALLALDVGSQVAAVTSLAGDVSVAGLCRALTDLLTQTEMQAASEDPARTARDWLVEPIDERGAFAAWIGTVERVTRVNAQFHLPNPSASEELDPVVDYLNRMGAARGSLMAATEEGLDPAGHPMMQSAIAMQEQDYGTITAEGVRPSGERDHFRSREHITRDTLSADPQDPEHLSLRGLVARLFLQLGERLGAGLR